MVPMGAWEKANSKVGGIEGDVVASVSSNNCWYFTRTMVKSLSDYRRGRVQKEIHQADGSVARGSRGNCLRTIYYRAKRGNSGRGSFTWASHFGSRDGFVHKGGGEIAKWAK